jgi:hypothetical protein
MNSEVSGRPKLNFRESWMRLKERKSEKYKRNSREMRESERPSSKTKPLLRASKRFERKCARA